MDLHIFLACSFIISWLLIDAEAKLNIFCYLPSDRNTGYSLNASYVAARVRANCTHYIYDGVSVRPKHTSGFVVIPQNYKDRKELEVLADMANNTDIRVLLSIRANITSPSVKRLLSSESEIDDLIRFTISYMFRYKLDGLTIHWNNEHEPTFDFQPYIPYYSYLLKKMRSELDKASQTRERQSRGKYLLILTIEHNTTMVQEVYDITVLNSVADYVIVETFDYFYENQSPVTAPHNALRRGINETANTNQRATLEQWLNLWIPRKKLVAAIPTFGRVYQLATDPGTKQVGIGVPVVKSNVTGTYSGQVNYFTYRRICELLNTTNTTTQWLKETLQNVPYFNVGRTWVTFENPDSAKAKVWQALRGTLAGVAISSLADDDFLGNCEKGVTFPITLTVSDYIIRHLSPWPRRPSEKQLYFSSDVWDDAVTELTGGRKCGTGLYLPYMKDCNKFIQCDRHNYWHVMPCPSYLYFNIVSGTCDYPYNVEECNYWN